MRDDGVSWEELVVALLPSSSVRGRSENHTSYSIHHTAHIYVPGFLLAAKPFLGSTSVYFFHHSP